MVGSAAGCFYTLTIFYYSDWAGGFVNSSGNGDPLVCPDRRASLRSNIDYTHRDLPDEFYVYHDIIHHPDSFFKIWMRDGDVHNSSAQLAARYEGGKLVTMGQCDFPSRVENNDNNVFRFFEDNVEVDMVNLTLCKAAVVPSQLP
jgi:hypothetical protein